MAVEFWGGASAEGPTFSNDPWELVTIGGNPLPGFSDVRGIAQLEVDKKKTKGAHGSTITITGYQPGPFEIVCTTWTEEQKGFLESAIDDLWNRPRKEPTNPRTGRPPVVAFDIDHPALQMLNITSCVVQGVTFPEPGPFEGSRVVRFKCMEHQNTGRKAVTKTAKGSVNVPLQRELRPPTKNETPAKPSTDKKQLGPGGPPAAPGGGSD